MTYREIPALLNSCKAVAKAYHCSVNFARAIHEAQIKVIIRPVWPVINIILRFRVAQRKRDLGLCCKMFQPAGTVNCCVCAAVWSLRLPSDLSWVQRNSNQWKAWWVTFHVAHSKFYDARQGLNLGNLKLICWGRFAVFWSLSIMQQFSYLMMQAASVRSVNSFTTDDADIELWLSSSGDPHSHPTQGDFVKGFRWWQRWFSH